MLAICALALLPTRRQCCSGLAAAAAAYSPAHAAVGSAFEAVLGSGTDGHLYGALKCGSSGTRALISSEPSLERIELALTMRCGHLFDPPEWEGLAHLASDSQALHSWPVRSQELPQLARRELAQLSSTRRELPQLARRLLPQLARQERRHQHQPSRRRAAVTLSPVSVTMTC